MSPQPVAAPSVIGEILDIDVMDITVGERLRPVDPEWAKALAGNCLNRMHQLLLIQELLAHIKRALQVNLSSRMRHFGGAIWLCWPA